MKNAISILLLFYYSFGTFVLPMSNFSVLANLPEMYSSCKETEHSDMNFLDFVTDHLLGFDAVFDKHDHNDQQKPHRTHSISLQNVIIKICFNLKTIEFKSNLQFISIHLKHKISFKNSLYCYNFKNSVFRPPIEV
jgi:hypothetical protein